MRDYIATLYIVSESAAQISHCRSTGRTKAIEVQTQSNFWTRIHITLHESKIVCHKKSIKKSIKFYGILEDKWRSFTSSFFFSWLAIAGYLKSLPEQYTASNLSINFQNLLYKYLGSKPVHGSQDTHYRWHTEKSLGETRPTGGAVECKSTCLRWSYINHLAFVVNVTAFRGLDETSTPWYYMLILRSGNIGFSDLRVYRRYGWLRAGTDRVNPCSRVER